MFGKIYGVLSIVFGLFLLHSLYLLKRKGEISHRLLPKDTRPQGCKDKEGYEREISPYLGGMGGVLVLYGASDLYVGMTGQGRPLMLGLMGLTGVMLIVFIIRLQKVNQKYF